ncbi:UPF0149 family protein [Caballeronia sp. GAWG1-1]|uniref:UPF0149 family protein n=1 Tax=Caballeronia sp. GAWG1-1 TaxID=2921742 RepID=UPI002029437A
MPSIRPDNLSDDELNQLDDFLASVGPNAMNVEMVDGFFAALACCPDLIKSSEWFPEIWNTDFEFDSERQATEITGLLIRHWNVVVGELARTLDSSHHYEPVLEEDESGVANANDWAHGFIRGVGMRAESWSSLLRDDTRARLLAPVLALHHEHDDNRTLQSLSIENETRDGLIGQMCENLSTIYRFFEPQRKARAAGLSPTPLKRLEPKVGRNDPCPCGSGRKYKQCCGGNLPTLH